MGEKNESNGLRGQRYIALVRSSDDTEGTTSTEAQLAMAKFFAEQNGIIRTDDMILNGISGSLPGNRTDLEAILRRKVEQNDFEVLLVQRLDRLTRGGSDHGFWFEHECKRVGIKLIIIGDDIPEGPYASLVKVAKYEGAREQAYSISQRSTQGYQMAMEQGRVVTSSHTPYACWRLYLNMEGTPLHIIRDLRDGRQQKLDAKTHAVIDTYGQIGGGSKGHYRKQKQEKVLLVPGDPQEIAIVREIFETHYLKGWGGKRIADQLNRRGIRSPQGRAWSQRQVEVIYYQEVYTGRSIGNRTSSAIYHRRNCGAPQIVNLDPSIHAMAMNVPVQMRPSEEWFVQIQPSMEPFLGNAQLRLSAIEGQDKFWQHQADPDRVKLTKSKHRTSDYLLTGLLHAKQDGAALTGILCGAIGHKVRYYRHRRGRTGYVKGSVFNKMIHAQTVEKAVLAAAQDMLLSLPELRGQLLGIISQNNQAVDHEKLDGLRKRREQLRRKTQLIVATIDEETMVDVQAELERLKVRRRELDAQIAAMESANSMGAVDPDAVADAVISKLKGMAEASAIMPILALRQWLGSIVEKVIADMETKSIEIRLMLPAEILKESALLAQKPMRLVQSSASSGSYETHQAMGGMNIGIIDCDFIKASNHICYECHRRKAA